MLYKYLNPNLIAVGTEVTPDTKPGISIYLLDAVTGTAVTVKADLHGTIFAYDCRMRFL